MEWFEVGAAVFIFVLPVLLFFMVVWGEISSKMDFYDGPDDPNGSICLVCGRGPMKTKIARQGYYAGESCLGCRAYPNCTGIRTWDGSPRRGSKYRS
jgi:hypothetical protein